MTSRMSIKFSRQNVERLERLYQGPNRVIYRASIQGAIFCVKEIDCRYLDSAERRAVRQNIRLSETFHHKHILPILG